MSPPPPSSRSTQITQATASNIPSIKRIIDAAYTKYIPRIGKPPAPMTTDYAALLDTHEIYILSEEQQQQQPPPNPGSNTSGDAPASTNIDASVRPATATKPTIVGSIVLHISPQTLHINNLVVDPVQQGKGYGKVLMKFAEDLGRQRGCESVELYTNVKMWENLVIYRKAGFEEVGRRVEDGFERAYFRKGL